MPENGWVLDPQGQIAENVGHLFIVITWSANERSFEREFFKS